MGNIFSLDDDTKQVISDALDDILANTNVGGLGKTCKLVYPERYVSCPNCIPDTFGGKSSNRYRTGGRIPFTATQACPVCSGAGKAALEVSEEITLKCNWEPKSFIRPVKNLQINIPYSIVETKGYMTDLPKILKATALIINLPIAPYIKQTFRLLGEPGDPSNIIQGRYFIATWERSIA
jgi:hypothetical protein